MFGEDGDVGAYLDELRLQHLTHDDLDPVELIGREVVTAAAGP